MDEKSFEICLQKVYRIIAKSTVRNDNVLFFPE